jgi:hypothetical protein
MVKTVRYTGRKCKWEEETLLKGSPRVSLEEHVLDFRLCS